MQLLTEAPAIRVDAGYGVVTEVKLVQRWKAIERATVYFCQAVILQVAVEKNKKELTDNQHWSNAEEFPTRTGILAIPTFISTYLCGHVHVWAFLVQAKDRNSRTTQRKCPQWAVTAEVCSAASKLGLKHPIQVSICRVSAVWQAASRNMLPWSLVTLQTHSKVHHVRSFKHFSAMTIQFVLSHGKKTSLR